MARKFDYTIFQMQHGDHTHGKVFFDLEGDTIDMTDPTQPFDKVYGGKGIAYAVNGFKTVFGKDEQTGKTIMIDQAAKVVEVDVITNYIPSDELQDSEISDMAILNKLYYIFNMDHPNDYRARSLSISDIVKIDNKYYTCESCGWREIVITKEAA
jgi:hypothetical protein